MEDRELLELAAKAAGLNVKGEWVDDDDKFTHLNIGKKFTNERMKWNPLTDDGDALRLAVKINLSADFFDDTISVGYTPNDNECDQVHEFVGTNPYAATRRAIVRAAAEISKQIPQGSLYV